MRRVSHALQALLAPGAAFLLSGCTTPAMQADAGETAAPRCPQTRNWTAHVDAMPGPDARPRLIVAGEADVPQGFVATLRAGPTDRMMPPGQRVMLALEPGSGPQGWQPVRLESAPALPQYREVRIGCADEPVATITDIPVAQ